MLFEPSSRRKKRGERKEKEEKGLQLFVMKFRKVRNFQNKSNSSLEIFCFYYNNIKMSSVFPFVDQKEIKRDLICIYSLSALPTPQLSFILLPDLFF